MGAPMASHLLSKPRPRPSWATRLAPVGRHGWLVRTPGFTADEVRALLATGATGPRGKAVGRVLARTTDWLPPEPNVVSCPIFYWQRLPRILWWYTRGETTETIARRLSAFGTPWGVERAITTACANIAARLNRSPEDYGAQSA